MSHNSRYPPPRGSYRPPPRDYRNDRDFRDRNGPPPRDAYRPSSYASHKDHNSDGRRSREGGPPPHMDSRGPPGVDNYRPPQGDFNFRFDKPAGVKDSDSYRPQNDRRTGNDYRDDRDSRAAKRHRGPNDRSFRHDNGPQSFRGNRTGRGGYGGRPWRPFVAAERELLKTDHNPGSEVAFFNTAGGVTYRPLDELSDSDEAEMDISGDEAETTEEPSNKRARLAVEQSASDNNAPKWSNPDPYTALPPETATQGKKKDVVQMIRKSRVEAKAARTSLPESADFISFDFDDSDASDNDEDEASEPAIAAAISAAPAVPSAKLNLQLPPKPPAREPAKAPALLPDPMSSALGSRKRTHDDEIKMPHAPLKKATKMPAGGGITKEWVAISKLTSTPWMEVDHSGSANVAVW